MSVDGGNTSEYMKYQIFELRALISQLVKLCI